MHLYIELRQDRNILRKVDILYNASFKYDFTATIFNCVDSQYLNVNIYNVSWRQ